MLAHDMLTQQNSTFPLFTKTQALVETSLASETLKARARQMRDDFVHALAAVLAEEVGRAQADAEAYLGATLIASTWSVAFVRAHDLLRGTGGAEAARRMFLTLIDRGFTGTRAALSGTPYT